MATEIFVGTVVDLSCYPVKSLAGITMISARVDELGLQFDRHWVILNSAGELVTAKAYPKLGQVRVEAISDAGPIMQVASARGLYGSAAAQALSQLLGESVQLKEKTEIKNFTKVAPLHLLGRESNSLGQRANVILDLPDPDSCRTWLGRTLYLGSTILSIDQLPRHCPGAYAWVQQSGQLNVGDQLRFEPQIPDAP
jgi:uncharacterized protein